MVMPIQLNQLREIVLGLGYSASVVGPPEPGLTFAMPVPGGSRNVAAVVEQNGELIHLRALISYCDERRSSLLGVLRALAAVNLRSRTVRIGWDASQGAIVACAELWLAGEGSQVRPVELFVRRFQLEFEKYSSRLCDAVMGKEPVSASIPVEIDDDMI
jgi:hypothetical protein